VRSLYITSNLAKNAAAPAVLPLIRSRGSLGMDGDLDAVVGVLNRLAPGLSALGGGVGGRRLLELGPGRTAELSGAFVLAGAASAVGMDTIVQTPPEASGREHYSGLVERLGREDARPFVEAAGSTPERLRQRYAELGGAEWPSRFDAFDGARLPLEDASVDLVVSKSVLEHVPLQGVPGLLSELHRVLRPGGGMVHVIDLRDHMHVMGDRAVQGDWLDALRYPEWLFNAMFSRRSTAINRLREPQWRELVRAAGFEAARWELTRFPLPPGFDAGRLQPPWRDYGDDVLGVGWIDAALTKSE
jgi:SAM-dependent methyltransferase